MTLREDTKKAHLLVENRADLLTQLCSDIVKVPSVNPPGDTRGVVEILEPFLAQRGFTTEVRSIREEMPNLIASWPPDPGDEHPHIILNGHIDVFPVDPTEEWSFDPFSGEIVEGRILGRGGADMKGGVAASIGAALALKEVGESLPGRLTLTLVSDEEMGSRNGAAWLLSENPDLRGDVAFSGEPTGPNAVIYGERGVNDITISARGASGPGAAYLAGSNAIMRLVSALPVVQGMIGWRTVLPEDLAFEVDEAREVIDEFIFTGGGKVLDIVTLNVGTIRGGTNRTVTPVHAEAGVNFRVPVGISPYEFFDELRRRLDHEGFEDVSVTWDHDDIGINGAYYTSPDDLAVVNMVDSVELVTGKRPKATFGGGATDMRYYRRFGVPAVQHGPRSYPVFAASPDEFIYVSELIDTAKAHAAAILGYMDDWQEGRVRGSRRGRL